MIRKAIIMVLTLGAISVTAMSVMSYGTRIRNEECWLTDQDIVLFCCDAGHIKLIWIHAEKGGKSLQISCGENEDDDTLLYVPPALWHLDRIIPSYVPRVVWRTTLPTQPPCRLTQIQVWAWLVVAAFAAYPTLAFIRGPLRRYHRRKRGLCLRCGYSLEGNVSGVCSECGEEV